MKKVTNEIKVYTGLPPKVPGTTRGILTIQFPLLQWDCTTPPPAPRLGVFLKWWGETTGGCVFRVPVEYKQKLHPSIRPSSARYNIVSSWKQFSSYLKDAGHLTLIVGLGRDPNDMLVMGECSVPNLANITPEKLEKRSCTVATSDGKVRLGRLVVEIIVKMNSKINKMTGNHQKPVLKPSYEVAQPDKPVCLVTVPVTNRKWKPVGRVQLGPHLSSGQSKEEVPLGGVSRLMVEDLITQAQSLHRRITMAVDGKESHVMTNIDRLTKTSSPPPQTLGVAPPIIIDESVGVVDVTPPPSPSESMVEMATLMYTEHDRVDNIEKGVTQTIDLNIPQKERTVKPTPCSLIRIETPPKVHQDKPARLPAIQRRDAIPLPPVDCLSVDPKLFHMLLEISKGSGIVKSSDPVAQPNVYIKCRLFCLKTPVQSEVFANTRDPSINFKQILPVCIGWSELLQRLQKGYAVIEVWDTTHTADSTVDTAGDELLGLVKISLYPVYAAIWSLLRDPSHEESLFPVVAVDGCCPIKDLCSSNVCGHLTVRLVWGTPTDIPAKFVPVFDTSFQAVDHNDTIHSVVSPQHSDTTHEHSMHEEYRHLETHVMDTSNKEHESTKEHETTIQNITQEPLTAKKEEVQIELLISEALHLPQLSNLSESVPPSAYVTCHAHPSVNTVSTGVCVNTTGPHWDYHCTTCIPQSFMEAPFCELELQVWSLPPNTEEYQSADPKTHIFLGRAFVDLVPLQYGLRSLVGWYSIMNLAGELQGELKIAITPKGMIVPRRELQANDFYYSRSLLPVEIDIYSSSFPPVTNNSYHLPVTNNIFCDRTDQFLSRDETSLSILRQQLQLHVSELETIQDSLEAKLRQHSLVMGVSPSSSTCTPPIPVSSPSHPPLSSPSLGEQLISEPPLSPTHSIKSDLLTPPNFPINSNEGELEPFTISPPSCFNKTSTPLKSRDSTITANETSQSIIDHTMNTSTSSANDGLEGRTPNNRESTAVLSENATHVSGNNTTVNEDEPTIQVESQMLNVEYQQYKREEDIVDNRGEKDTEIDDKTSQVLDTGLHTVEGKACMSMESSRETSDSDGVSSSLNSSVSSIIKVVDISNQSDPSNTSEDTSIMVRTAVPNEQGPGLLTDDDLEEEEEVKRLFDKLLKERHQKSDQTQSSNSTSSSDSSDSFDDSSSSSSDSTINSNMGSPNKPVRNPETSAEMKQLDDTATTNQLLLAQKLLNLRQSALSRRPPRLLQNIVVREESSKDNPKRPRINPPRLKTPERERLKRIFYS